MKTCDVCKRTNGAENPVEEGWIVSTSIGTNIQSTRIGEDYECSFEVDLCCYCLPKVNDAIADFLKEKFGFPTKA